MPVIDLFQPDELTKVVVWEITETEEELLQCSQMNYLRWEKLEELSAKRRLEFLGLRACLKVLGQDLDLFYDSKGKPYLPNNNHISITHSYGLVAVAISEHGIGIDVELDRTSKLVNIRKKFISNIENSWLRHIQPENEHLAIIWGLKEALYKLTGGKHWNFLHHYYTEQFSDQSPFVKIWLHDEFACRKYFGHYKKIKNHYLVWVLDYE